LSSWLATLLLSSGATAFVTEGAGLRCVHRRASAPCPSAHVLMLAKKKKGGKKRAEPAAAAVATAEPAPEIEAEPAAQPPAAITGGEDIFPLADGAWARRRVSADQLSFGGVLSAVSGCSDDDALAEFVQTNRDLLDYRWLYRLTGELLRAQNTGETAREAELRELRARIIRQTQAFDAPLFKQIGEAEGRLGQLLGRYVTKNVPDPTSDDVVAASGSSAMQVFAFWMVILAAIAAWESKLAIPSASAMAKAKLEELSTVVGALESAPGLLDSAGVGSMNMLLALPNHALPGADASEAKAALASLGLSTEDTAQLLRKVGCVSCQATRHAFQAYNPLVQKSAALFDVLQFGSVQPLTAPDIALPDRLEYTSNLVRLAEEADKMDIKRDIELYW